MKRRLELTWLGKEHYPRPEPRILVRDGLRSYHAAHRVSEEDLFDNRLICGDNLLALRALEAEFAGRIDCVCIDPPYNTGSAFEHFDDGIEHSIWLTLMRDRLELLRRLMAESGSLWITIDDNEAHYLKVLCDEIFGRSNFVVDISWHKRISPANDAKFFSGDTDHILVFAKNKDLWRPRRLPRNATQLAHYKNVDHDPRGLWNSTAYTCAKTADERPNLYYPITNPNSGEEVWPRKTRVWAYDRSSHARNVERGLLYWGKDGMARMPRFKKFLDDAKKVVPRSFWTHEEAGHNQEAKLETDMLFPGNPFATPKPERLIKRILDAATAPGDLVLDSFAGSGTTGAVAHKMGRRWIMVESGNHCETHIAQRMRKVIDGTDGGGVTEAVGWKGGGGFQYFALAQSLLERDDFGNWIINRSYNAPMLAEALCKLEGFTYAPSESLYWQHGYSSETDFVYVTTQTLNQEQLQRLSDEVGFGRSLMVLCAAFRAKADTLANLTVKKIPKHVLARCEWGRDDYSGGIAELEFSLERSACGSQQSVPISLFDEARA